MPVIYYTARQVRCLYTMEGWEVTEREDDSHDDLGHMVAIWQVSTGQEGKVFDLIDLEDRGVGCFEAAAEDLCDTMTLSAFKLPENAYVLICFPKEEAGADDADTGSEDAAAAPGDV